MRIGEVDHLFGDVDQKTLQFAFVPVGENFFKLGVIEATEIFEKIVGFGDELHVAVFDAVVHHFDEVTRPAVPAIGNAGDIVAWGFRGDFLKNRADMLVTFAIATGHDAGAPERAFFATADAHAEEFDAGRFEVIDTAFGIGEEGVPAVHDDVAGLEQRLEFVNHRVDGFAGLDHDENPTWPFKVGDEVRDFFKPFGILALGQFIDEVFGLGVGAIIDRDGETVALDVECDIPPHDFQSDHAECLAAHDGILALKIREFHRKVRIVVVFGAIGNTVSVRASRIQRHRIRVL